MLERFRLFQRNLLKNLKTSHKRYFYEELKSDEKLLGILGARGVGKTTALLQYLKESEIPMNEKLYISADWIDGESLFEIAEAFYKENGKLLIIDEIHKYPNFEKELKIIYDILDLRVIVSGSSALSINHAKADLSRRMLVKEVKGMSFREFLKFKYKIEISKITLDELLKNHIEIAYEILEKIDKPSILPDFKEYLEVGYYPFYFQNKDKISYLLKLKETINVVLEVDIPAISNIKFTTIRKFKKLIEYICTSHPFKPNMKELLTKMEMPKTAYAEAYEYLELLQKAKIIRLIKSANKKDAILTKPEKIYLNNTNLHFCYCETQEIGTLREVFFVSMLENYEIYVPDKGDFIVNGYTFEIGGKNKTKKQVKDVENAYVVADDIEIGSGSKIPLWLFGFLY
ncbi:ATP-binding protein [Caminibacter pacificus]